MKNNSDKIILSVQELLSGAHTSDLVPEEAAEEEQEAKLKDARARRDEEWSLLANQVVGGETGIFPVHNVACVAEQKQVPKADGTDDASSKCCGL